MYSVIPLFNEEIICIDCNIFNPCEGIIDSEKWQKIIADNLLEKDKYAIIQQEFVMFFNEKKDIPTDIPIKQYLHCNIKEEKTDYKVEYFVARRKETGEAEYFAYNTEIFTKHGWTKVASNVPGDCVIKSTHWTYLRRYLGYEYEYGWTYKDLCDVFRVSKEEYYKAKMNLYKKELEKCSSATDSQITKILVDVTNGLPYLKIRDKVAFGEDFGGPMKSNKLTCNRIGLLRRLEKEGYISFKQNKNGCSESPTGYIMGHDSTHSRYADFYLYNLLKYQSNRSIQNKEPMPKFYTVIDRMQERYQTDVLDVIDRHFKNNTKLPQSTKDGLKKTALWATLGSIFTFGPAVAATYGMNTLLNWPIQEKRRYREAERIQAESAHLGAEFDRRHKNDDY